MSQVNLPDQLVFHGNGGTYPPHGAITATDHGPAVVTFNWIMFSLTGLAAIARFATRRNLSPDCLCILGALLLLVLDSVAIHLAASNGLGRHLKDLSPGQYDIYSKSFYGSEIMEVLILMLSKLSYLFIYLRIISTSSSGMRPLRLFITALVPLVALWGTGTALAFAFQCALPSPWNQSNTTCINQNALYYTTGGISILTDILIVAIPAAIVSKIQIQVSERVNIWAIFATRIVVIITTAVWLGELGAYLYSSDPTWYNDIPTIWMQVTVNLAIITACIPLMKPFLDMLQFSLVDTSTLPFSVQAGVYAETHTSSNRSPNWSNDSKEKSSGSRPHERKQWRRARNEYSLETARTTSS